MLAEHHDSDIQGLLIGHRQAGHLQQEDTVRAFMKYPAGTFLSWTGSCGQQRLIGAVGMTVAFIWID